MVAVGLWVGVVALRAEQCLFHHGGVPVGVCPGSSHVGVEVLTYQEQEL